MAVLDDYLGILLNEIRVSGFRGLADLEISIGQLAVLIGPNNCGKTSVLKAIQLALGDYGRHLADADFHIDVADQRRTEIVVDVRFVPVDEEQAMLQKFDPEWQNAFGDKIRADAAGQQFFGFRTTAKPEVTKVGFKVDRHLIQVWPEFADWLAGNTVLGTRVMDRLELVPFVSIDAQRDIHTELNEKSSFVGKVLATVKYDADDVQALEGLIAEVNEQALDKSPALTRLKAHLGLLNASFGGNGEAEVTPFPKKLRDLSRRFSVHFGSTAASSFSMEYHGMGTRSWASMLAVKAFSEMMAETHQNEEEPYHPILGAEEPEAHLHPNAQRALFAQLSGGTGQAIVSTHSPYLAAMAELQSLRSLSVRDGKTSSHRLVDGISKAEIKALHREVLRNKGEILYSRALVLFEGQTEEQVVPAMFKKWFGKPAFEMGVNLVSVNGQNYAPFIKLAGSFGIPVYVVSDNDGNTSQDLQRHLAKIQPATGLQLTGDWFVVDYLEADNDFEAELISVVGLSEQVKAVFVQMIQLEFDNPLTTAGPIHAVNSLSNVDLTVKMRKDKTGYSGFLADSILASPDDVMREQLIPMAFQRCFIKITEWLE